MKKLFRFPWWPLGALLVLGGCAGTLSLGGCSTLQSITPAAALDALENAVNVACGAVPIISSLEAVLKADGISNPTETQITMVAQQICAGLVPPKAMTARVAGSPSAPVILGYVNGVPVYGYWTK
jgi:hypothetical protein